ncbi:MAG: TetR/AcrR family transcriptional regulator [Betaproteobacteria bacterium]|jgi:TetR/AcrR family transcriptional repressor of nem operon
MTSSSREKLIRSTQALMLSRGYSATGVDDICRDARVSKGSFYHQFSSKEDLAIAALGDFYEAGLKKLLAINLSDVPPERRLLAFLDAIAKQGHNFWKDGCLIGSLASEMSLSSKSLQTEVSRLFSETVKALEPLIEPFVASLQDKSLSAAALAEQYLVVVEGAIVMSRAHNDPMKINQAVARLSEQLRWLPRGKTGDVQQAGKRRQKR